MEKKIGCVIAYKKGQNNYGTSLQAYALLKTIQNLGYKVEVINYIKKLSIGEKMTIAINRFRVLGIKKFIADLRKRTNTPPELVDQLKLRTKAVDAYKEKKLKPMFENYIGYRNLSMGSKKYDAVVVGSDQVWLPVGLKTKFYNLLFVDDNVRKVSYASSFGVHEIPRFQRKATGEYLNRFYKIGVRELRGKEIVENVSCQKAHVVADPTILLTREEWEEEIKNTTISTDEPFIFCYLISENETARNEAKKLAQKKGLKIICVRHLEKYRSIDETYGDYAPYDVDPNGFVKYIRTASYVCTDSFHCTVFSHIFHKQFITFYRTSFSKNARNSRIDSLFEMLGTNKKHIFDYGGIGGIDAPIDWDCVDRKLAKFREDSLLFLSSSLD